MILIEETCSQSSTSAWPSAKADMKKLWRSKIIIIIIRDFDIQTDHQLSARPPNLIIVKMKKKKKKKRKRKDKQKTTTKNNLPNRGLCCPGYPQSKIERKWKEG